MKIHIIAFVSVITLSVADMICSAPAESFEKGDLEVCLQNIETLFEELIVPDEVKKMAESIRSINPDLAHLSLTKLVQDESAEFNLTKAGVDEHEMVGLTSICDTYIKDIEDRFGRANCDDEQIDLLDPSNENYDATIAKHPKLDEAIGFGEMCL